MFLAELNQLSGLFAAFFKFDASIKIFRIFTNDNKIDILVTAAGSRNRKHRTKANIEIQGFTKRDIHTAKTSTNRGGNRALDRYFVATDRIDS